MWNFESKMNADKQRVHVCIKSDGQAISMQTFLDLLESTVQFRDAFIQTLSDSPFVAYRWEMPAITESSAGRPCEFVVVNSPEIMMAPDRRPFRDRFIEAGAENVAGDVAEDAVGDVLVFQNLGRDATLIVPTPTSASDDFSQVATFTQNAPMALQHQLWQRVAATLKQLVNPRPLWLSTAGGGVAWLHVRIDQRPKYYSYAPYRSE